MKTVNLDSSVSVNGDVLRADHLLGHGTHVTDGNVLLAWSLGERDLYDALNDLICGYLSYVLGGFYAVGALDCALDNLLVTQESGRKAVLVYVCADSGPPACVTSTGRRG